MASSISFTSISVFEKVKREGAGHNPSFPFSAQQTIIATTVVGGVLILILLAFALHRRQRLRAYAAKSSSATFDHEKQQTVTINGKLSAFSQPIYSTVDLSNLSPVSSIQPPVLSKATAPSSASRSVGLPRGVSRATQSSIRLAPQQHMSFLADPTPPSSALSSGRKYDNAFPSPTKPADDQITPLNPAVLGPHVDGNRTSRKSLSPRKPPALQKSERWSWTNSEAPPTPRLYAPSIRASGASFVWFKRRSAASSNVISEASQRTHNKSSRQAVHTMSARRPSLRRFVLKDPPRRLQSHKLQH